MSQIMDIDCMSRTHVENNNLVYEIWHGTFKLEEDGWFEGIAKDRTGAFNGDSFVFGVCFPGKTIELYKLCPVTVHNPYAFYGNNIGDHYSGHFDIVDLLGPTTIGDSEIKIACQNESDVTMDQIDEDIQSCKDNLDDTCALFYQRFLQIRKSLCQITLRNYECHGFTDEEYAHILAECEPVTEATLHDTAEEYMRLIREKPIDVEFDDDLPF